MRIALSFLLFFYLMVSQVFKDIGEADAADRGQAPAAALSLDDPRNPRSPLW